LGNNSMVINLQMFTSSYGSSVFPHVTRAPIEFFFIQICFLSRPGCVGFRPTQKISEEGQVSSQWYDVTNQL